MRIAQVAPLWEPVPAPRYGAVETHIAELANGLTRRGHDVTVFASGDSTVEGLVPVWPRALNHDPDVVEPEAIRLAQMQNVLAAASDFDVIHSHLHSNSGLLGLLALQHSPTPVVHTIHCFRNASNAELFDQSSGQAFIAISEAQRASLPRIDFHDTIPHGVDISRVPFQGEPTGPRYLAFLGRLRPEKGVHTAIAVARRAGLPLRIAGRIKPADEGYFQRRIAPHLNADDVMYLGELGYDEKFHLLSGAYATLVPTTLPEPFGLVTIESMAAGTPVVAMDAGAVRELVRDGVTGFVGKSADDLTNLLERVEELDRRACRDHVHRRFSTETMVGRYENSYQRLVRSHRDFQRRQVMQNSLTRYARTTGASHVA